MNHIIKNFESLNTNSGRGDALSIIEAGSYAIDTTLAIKNNVLFENGNLSIKGNNFDLNNYDRVFVIGFGKASCKAVQALEDVLGSRLSGGVVIDKNPEICRVVEVYKGTHPLPSKENFEATEKIINLAKNITEKDFVIVIVSGGGSALLCYPLLECEQGDTLYKTFLSTGGTIEELNILRKHISEIKGGGLAKILYPATITSLIFCDVPGDHYADTASGPTYLDNTTIDDAKKILEKYSIKEDFIFNDTPKDKMYFEKVTNIPFISNKEALKSMKITAEKLGYEVIYLGDEIYDTPDVLLNKMINTIKPHSVVIAGGELSVISKIKERITGRNLFISGKAVDVITSDDVFISFASDGIDNLSISAGAIVDIETKNKIKENNVNCMSCIDRDAYDELFKIVGDNIVTGPTGSNVSDLYLMLRK